MPEQLILHGMEMKQQVVRTDSYLQEAELSVTIRVTGRPDSISDLLGRLSEDQLGVDSIARLANELGGSYSAPSNVVVTVYPLLPEDKEATHGKGVVIPFGTRTNVAMRWIQSRIGIPSEAHVIEGSVDVVVAQPR